MHEKQLYRFKMSGGDRNNMSKMPLLTLSKNVFDFALTNAFSLLFVQYFTVTEYRFFYIHIYLTGFFN